MADEVSNPEQLFGVAAQHATTDVPIAGPKQSAGEVLRKIIGRRFECADDIAVLDGKALVGIVPIERLLAADGSQPIEVVMDADPPTLDPGAPQEVIAWKMVERNESSLAVIDERGRFAGLIPPHRMLAVLLADHDRDMARIGGYVAGTRRARLAAEESVRQRLVHRLPWLLLGLAGAMLSALIVGAFEEQLQKKVLIAFFLPGVVYMADAVGTQTETVLIRGLSVGVGVRAVLRHELLTGAIIGGLIAAAFLPFALAVWGDADVAIAVALALLASCSIATLVALVLPATFQRLGADPAFGSGPLATVVQDLLSIVVYFAIATAIAT